MCLIVFSFDAHADCSLILAANRDEFYARPTAPAAFWQDASEILAGRDLAAGGTWLGVTSSGRFAAVTNYREPLAPAGVKSRGQLTTEFLNGNESPENYLQKIKLEKDDYSGFNLIVGDFAAERRELFYYSNRAAQIVELTAGIYGLSNHLLDTNWHKVESSKAKLANAVQKTGAISSTDLLQILADRRVAADEKLPETGVGIERERVLSAAFIETNNYGTRSSTVLMIKRNGQVDFHEKTFIGATGDVNFQFVINKSEARAQRQIPSQQKPD